jgi:hypothetical protein
VAERPGAASAQVGAAVSVEIFLRQRAVNIAVDGSYSLKRRWYDAEGKLRSFACRTTRVSPFRMLVEVPIVGQVGERMTSYFREFGELEGIISHTRPGGFLVEMEMTAARRARLAEQLTWLEKKSTDASVQDVREDARIIPPPSHSVLILADGSVHGCFIIDISSSGAAISAEVQPPIGTPLAIGAVWVASSGFSRLDLRSGSSNGRTSTICPASSSCSRVDDRPLRHRTGPVVLSASNRPGARNGVVASPRVSPSASPRVNSAKQSRLACACVRRRRLFRRPSAASQ